ncbi:GLPGLI family protein [Polaribacter litorisediminis]|uniref:GLPGLI family protein n=1 Tax=Polaribacter litorisediminis TaxID=1908341 RepID=UPI001CBA7161|nr:GLPGLI family protein [Polaribacter litorisediminis]UAM97884.1 GLPGLI family protein [Polaribacter litorisediminis]
MKFLKFYIYFFITFSSFSQSGEVIYEAEIIPIDFKKKIKNDTITKSQKETLGAIFRDQSKVRYRLVFTREESYFEKYKTINLEKDRLNFAERKMGKGIYYINKNLKEIIHHKFYSGQEFLIEIPSFNWKLSQETRQIGKYICYKATTTKHVEGRNGKMERKIIAWYTEEISYNFGPKYFSGLPGLILELQEDNLLIQTSKIILEPKKKLVIKKPNKGEKVTLKEYDSIVKEMYYSRRRRN